jgi:hypothetical protein
MWLGEAADRRPTRRTPRARMPVKGRAGCQGRRGAWRCGARTGAEMAQGKRFCHCASLMRTGVVWPSCGPCRVVLSVAPHPACIRQSFTTTALFGYMHLILGRLDGDDLAVAGGGRRYSPNAVQAMVRRK